MNKSKLVQSIGETDQQFLVQNSPQLALKRGQLRLKLIALSTQKQEQHYFLTQAIAILEQARFAFDDIPLDLDLALSITLGQAYMMYFELTAEAKYALITQQILKPLSHHQHQAIYSLLADSADALQQKALAHYWQQKMITVYSRYY